MRSSSGHELSRGRGGLNAFAQMSDGVDSAESQDHGRTGGAGGAGTAVAGVVAATTPSLLGARLAPDMGCDGKDWSCPTGSAIESVNCRWPKSLVPAPSMAAGTEKAGAELDTAAKLQPLPNGAISGSALSSTLTTAIPGEEPDAGVVAGSIRSGSMGTTGQGAEAAFAASNSLGRSPCIVEMLCSSSDALGRAEGDARKQASRVRTPSGGRAPKAPSGQLRSGRC